jgi:hypothetical protein
MAKQAIVWSDRVPGIWSKIGYVIYLKAFDSTPYVALKSNSGDEHGA